MALFQVVGEYTVLVMMIFTSPYRLGEYHHDACSIFIKVTRLIGFNRFVTKSIFAI